MSAKHATIEVYRDDALKWRSRLKATNGAIVSDGGESYHRRRWCLRGAEIVVGAKPGSLQGLKPGESKLVHRKHDKVLVVVEGGDET